MKLESRCYFSNHATQRRQLVGVGESSVHVPLSNQSDETSELGGKSAFSVSGAHP